MAAFDLKLIRLKKYLLCTLSMTIVFWGEANGSSLEQMFFKIGVL